MIVYGIVFYAGLTSLVESVKKIITPVKPEYTVASLIIIAVAVVVKVILGKYVKAQGEKVNSGSLVASGQDALSDAVLSVSVLCSAILFMIKGISLEAYVGIIFSIMIIKSSIEMMTETLDEILGARADKEISKKIKDILCEEAEVRGAYDLIIYNYGPDKNYASVHLELPDSMPVKEVDKLTRKLEARVFKETGIILVGVGVYSYNTGDSEAAKIQNSVKEKVLSHEWVVQLHGFYIDLEKKKMRFDAVMSFDIDSKDGLQTLYDEMKKEFPDYSIQIVPDLDVSD